MISLARPSWLKTAIRASGRKMSSSAAPLLVTPTQLLDLTKSGNVSLLDASWYMPNSPRKPREEFQSKRVQGANFLDLDEVASPNDLGLKHMIPEERIFANACENFGITPSSHVVIYDSHGVFSSPRALFMFRAFGHHNSSILDGGLPRWSAEGLPVETKPPGDVAKSEYATPTLDKDAIRSYQQIVSNSKLTLPSDPTAELVVDARSRGRYTGADLEPRPGLSSGHIPQSFSLPFNTFLQTHKTADSSYTTFLPPDKIRQALVDAVGPAHAQAIISGERSIVATCGSGMTAGVLWLGLRLLGVQNPGLYDEDTLLVQRA
ncbi:hypothetical protein HWV62_17278 [Athelia sp. TMB]|nr:hypothetical protein HWV62_17278 [Athelia sp. TMB]